jgi:anaerobic dimethyl sulfoxide reductase subunit A
MTPTARFADIVLPVNTFMEREDTISPWLGSPYYLYMNRAIASEGESKSDRDICVELAPRLSISDYGDSSTYEARLKAIVEKTGAIEDFEAFRTSGVVKMKVDEPFVAFKEEIEDPEHHPFPTLSGKIEIYCEHLAEMEEPAIPPVAKHIPSREGCDDPLAKRYPLQLITCHHKSAVHGTMEGVPGLEEAEPRRLWISSTDARVRHIRDGDEVLVFNDRGKVKARAMVTGRIMPGVVDLAEGAWFDIDDQGVDMGGCANVLTGCRHSPGGAWSTNTSLVDVRKYQAADRGT